LRKYRSFRDDEQIGEQLDAVPKNERSTIIRMALRQYFGITSKPSEPSKLVGPIASDAARLVAKELMQNLRERSER